MHRRQHLHAVDRINSGVVPGNVLGAQLDHFADAVLRRIRGHETESLPGGRASTSLTTGGSRVSPPLIAWAVVTDQLWPCCR